MKTIICETCDWLYQVTEEQAVSRCPHCFSRKLEPVELPEAPRPPELVVPFRVDTPTVDRQVTAFASGIPYPPADLTPENLRKRLQKVFLPRYLVDAGVEASWQAEMGTDYEVVSHQEQYNNGGWQTLERKENRITWEPRVGRLQRSYQNIAAPALEEDTRLIRAMGDFSTQHAVSFTDSHLSGTFFRLPNRTTEDAWYDAVPRFQEAAAEECRQAAGADHVREYRWQPAFSAQNWTHLLLPVYTSYYLDDENRPQRVLMHGESGQIYGMRRSSMKRARTVAIWMVVAAVVIFAISAVLGLIGVAFPPLVIVAGIGAFAGLLTGVGAVYPVFRSWQFNKDRTG